MQKVIKQKIDSFILEPPRFILFYKNNQPESQIKHTIGQTIQKNQKKKRKQHLIVSRYNSALENLHH
jgi:hypothetical protein